MVFGKTYYVISDKEEDDKVLSSEAANYVSSSKHGAIVLYCQEKYGFRSGAHTVYYDKGKKSSLNKKVYLYSFRAEKEYRHIKDLKLIRHDTLEDVCDKEGMDVKEQTDTDKRKETYDAIISSLKKTYQSANKTVKSNVKIVTKAGIKLGAGITSDPNEWIGYKEDKLIIADCSNCDDKSIKKEIDDFIDAALSGDEWSKLPYPQAYDIDELWPKQTPNKMYLALSYKGFNN